MEDAMSSITKHIPIWLKEPLFLFATEMGSVPFCVAWSHARCSYAELRGLAESAVSPVFKKANHCIQRYLRKKYGYILNGHRYTPGIPVKNAPIWVFWWQGMEYAPEMVQRCVASIKRNSGSHPVHIITQRNYTQYVSLPAAILEKVGNSISLTHFSDILRMNLLADHGGYWLDATIFVTRSLPERTFDTPVYTGRNPGSDNRNISAWRWTGYAIAGWKGNSLFVLAKELFNTYWEHETRLIDYFLIDHVIAMIYEAIPEVRSQIDGIPVNNTDQQLLHEAFSKAVEPVLLESFLSREDTWLYKLTWKTAYPEQTADNGDTIYSRWKRITEEPVP